MEKKTNQLIDELFTTVEVIGVQKTFLTLKQAQSSAINPSDNIINIVCSFTNSTKQKLIEGRERTDARREIVMLAVYFLKTELGYTYSQISDCLRKDESAIFRYYKESKEILSNRGLTPFEKSFKENVKKIKALLNQKK